MSDDLVYFLSSLDSELLKQVRKCSFIDQVFFDSGKKCALARVEPPIIGQPFGILEDIDKIIITNRHEGEDVYDVVEFPCFVFVCIPTVDTLSEIQTKDDLRILAWGELYRTYSDAENHVFD